MTERDSVGTREERPAGAGEVSGRQLLADSPVLLTLDELRAVAGGLNPQPLPPGDRFRM
jgi:hypothetical protein